MANTNFKITSNIDIVTDEMKAAVIKWLDDAGNYVLDESNKIAPIDEGTLINSGSVNVQEDSLIAKIGYDTPYALRQHEDMSLRHKNGRQAKFLESAMKESLPVIEQLLKDRLRSN